MKTFSLAICTLVLAAAQAPAHVVTVDGDPSDWTGTPSATIHEAIISGDEWIYTGEASDLRTDAAGALGNYDIVEARLTFDLTGGDMYLLVRFADITVTNEVNVCIGIDNDLSAGDVNGLNFLGDESGLTFASTVRHPDYLVNIHNTTSGVTSAEYYHDAGAGSWFTNPGESDTFISVANDVLEARISLASIGLNPSQPFGFSLVTFDNGITGDPSGTAFNNDDDTTVDYPGQDGLDGVGGTPGLSQNAFDRIFSSGGGPYDPPDNTNFPTISTTTVTSTQDWWLLE